MSDFEALNDTHFDILREIGNIGAGNAVTALSKMLLKKIDMRIPQVKLLDFNEISSFIGGPENIIIGILVSTTGDVNGIMMFLVTRESARALTNILFGKTDSKELTFDEMELSALKEIGNILSSSYLGSLSTLTNKSIMPSVPYLSIDMAGAILSVPAIEFGKVADHVLFIESIFETENNDEREEVSGYFVLVPDPPSFQTILSSLGVN